MPRSRLHLFKYDVVRELCGHCDKERFHFVPTGAVPAPGTCPRCGSERKLAEISDTAIIRLVTQANGEVVVVPVIGRSRRGTIRGMTKIEWDIRREPRAWSRDEMNVRWPLTPEHFEAFDGKIFYDDEQRTHLLAMLLENVGIDAALRLAPTERWREALDAATALQPSS